jgi:hypothetical protein
MTGTGSATAFSRGQVRKPVAAGIPYHSCPLDVGPLAQRGSATRNAMRFRGTGRHH